MNKKIATEVAVVIIIIVALIVGALVLFSSKSVNNVTQTQPIKTMPAPAAQQPVKNNQYIVRTPVDTTNSYDTSKWLVYNNEKYGYSFKYPNVGWYIYASTNGVTFDKNEINEIKNADTVSIAINNSQDASHIISVSPQQDTPLVANENSKRAKDLTAYKEANVTFLGMDAVQATYSLMSDGKKDIDYKEISFNKNGLTFTLSGMNKDYSKNYKIDAGIFNVILSTFKFTN